MLNEKVEKKFFETIAAIRNSDEKLKDSSTRFFTEEDFEEPEQEAKPVKEKPIFYKDLVREQALKAFEENGEERVSKKAPPKTETFNDEQKRLKDEFLSEVQKADADEEDGLFQKRAKTQEEIMEEEKSFEEFLKEQKHISAPIEDMDLIRQFWGDDKELSAEDKFLRYYLLSQAWKEGAKPPKKQLESAKIDEEDFDRESEMDKYEADYNMRFEDGSGSFVPTHSRKVEESLRIKERSRKEKRKEREQRKKEEKEKKLRELNKAKTEEVKNVTKKLTLLEKAAGKVLEVKEKDLEEEFDPKEHEKMEKKVFGEEYYTQDDPNQGEIGTAKEEPEKEENEVQEESENQIEEWWFCDNCQKPVKAGDIRYDCTMCDNYTLCRKCFKTANHPHKLKKEKTPATCKPPTDHKDLIRRVTLACSNCGNNLAHIKGYECSECQQYFCKNCKADHPHEMKKIKDKLGEIEVVEPKTDLEALADKYIEQEYNDVVGGEIPVKFTYAEVPKENYGLTDEELLLLRDKEINALVPIKKIAAYKKDPNVDVKKILKKKKRLQGELMKRKKEAEVELKTGKPVEKTTKKNFAGKRHEVERIEIEKPTEVEGKTIKKSRLETYDLQQR
eukprot:TRINITY_DN304_c0_g1_i10.p3 TRINITY_DN304_c0_g1~~TRINITY_DN304_c0_g1_i10.p3  ORF type:complete len:616 (-),score=178.81 TRINITY_DN304_c0_g1_i10:24290-26137(-)